MELATDLGKGEWVFKGRVAVIEAEVKPTGACVGDKSRTLLSLRASSQILLRSPEGRRRRGDCALLRRALYTVRNSHPTFGTVLTHDYGMPHREEQLRWAGCGQSVGVEEDATIKISNTA